MVLIPRITFVLLSDDSWPIDWQRKQFPLEPAFVMTINKSRSNNADGWVVSEAKSVYPWTTICSYVKSRITSKVKSCGYE